MQRKKVTQVSSILASYNSPFSSSWIQSQSMDNASPKWVIFLHNKIQLRTKMGYVWTPYANPGICPVMLVS